MSNSAVILAAGEATRFGCDKLTLPLDGGSVLAHTVAAFRAIEAIDEIILVVPAGAVERYRTDFPDCAVVAGGATRQDSVAKALSHVHGDKVLLHDGARPRVSAALIRRILEALADHPAVIPTVSVTDSIIGPEGYLDRTQYAFVQTPQGFDTALLRHAFSLPHEDCTDEGQLVARYAPLHYVAGEAANVKLTHTTDYWGAAGRRATGIGYDIHRLVEGRPLRLAGVDIPYHKGLLGHSDADCCLHAVMDAALSAAALPDIGHYFPATAQWAGADSRLLTAIVMDALAAEGARITQVSLYIVAEAPRLAPYVEAMRRSLSSLLGIPMEAVGIGVTTNEQVPVRLGDLVTTEAIAAMATVTLTYATA